MIGRGIAFLRDAGLAVVATGLIVAAGGAPLWAQAAVLFPARTLDGFDELGPWKAIASDGVRATIHPADGPGAHAMRLDFDLGRTAGYALARRAISIDLPPNYEISFYVRADARVNNLQFKLIDASGDNVWWFNRPNFDFPRDWQQLKIKKRQIAFAWGPTTARALSHAASVEFVIAAGRGGGAGSVYFSDLAIRELPPEPSAWPVPSVQASSYLAGAEPSRIFDGDIATAWKSDPAQGATQSLTIDFGRSREFGGLILRWLEGIFASRYDVELSDDGERWRNVRKVVDGRGGSDPIMLPESEARFLRLVMHDGPMGAYGLAELEIEDIAFGASANAFFEVVARDSRRGTFPRGFTGEQTYWTIVGVDGGSNSGLLSEDGALEVAAGSFSIEPFVVAGTGVVTWADVDAQPFLVDDYLPMPGVIWRKPEWELRISSFASGSRAQSRLIARYELKNLTGHPLPLELVLGIRPFQVNPPTQGLNTAGGASAIRDARWEHDALWVNDQRRIFPLTRPDRVGVFPLDAGPIPQLIAKPGWSGSREIHDAAGYASAALSYRFDLAPFDSANVGIAVPLAGSVSRPGFFGRSPKIWIEREQRTVAAAWRKKLNRVELRVPAGAQPLVDTLRTALADLLIMRDGPILRPGTRSYARSWIRDGSMIAESLLRLGHPHVATDYLRWYAPHQFANGKVPCCVDERGADPVPENDSAGEFIFLADEAYRYTHDQALLRTMWPHVDAAARYLDSLRASERTDVNLAPANRAFYGLVPASISHEGYSQKPMHSYWDDFWTLKGYNGAVDIARALGKGGEADRLAGERDRFRRDLGDSLRQAVAAHGISYLPGAAELGDFDPTSTAIAFAPAGDAKQLPSTLVMSTYERYWREFIDRRDGTKAWEEYTPYELRVVGTFLRLGWRDRAHELLRFFFGGRRPAAWNQWAEVVGRDPRKARFVGDMPHGWVASDFIRSVLDIFAYERDADHALVLAAGVPHDWLTASGIAVKDLRTPYGRVSYTLKRQDERVTLRLAAGARLPPGGFVFVWPEGEPPPARINGKASAWNGNELHIAELPAEVVVNAR